MFEYFKRHDGVLSRSVSAENFTGEKGNGAKATEGTGKMPARDLGKGWKVSPSIVIKKGETFTLADVCGSGMISHIWLTHSLNNLNVQRKNILRIYWDGSDIPAVECPVGDFFASAHYDYFHISSEMICTNPRRGLNCYFKMPFKKGFKITIENRYEEDITVYYQIDYLLSEMPDDITYFHAQFRRTNPLPYKEDYVILDNIKGHGTYLGTYLVWGVNNNGWWGEGEIKFFLDGDKEYPTICGTGTEDYFCGAYNFDVGGKYESFSSLYSGMFVWPTDQSYASNRRFSLYRFHNEDPIFFDDDIKVTIQALGWRSGWRYLPLMDDISSVAYFYLDKPACVLPALPSDDYLEII